MGRRKQYMDDGDDSSDEEGGRISFNITDRDLEEEAEGFYGMRKRKRFAEEDDEDDEDVDMMRGGLGSSFTASGGINFQTARQSPQSTPKDPATERVRKSRESSRTPPSAPSDDFAKFTAHTTGFGLKMLQKMGWRMGEGLGGSREGIVNPIETRPRPARMGMGFRGFDERTEQAKQEARARGEVFSEEEEEVEGITIERTAKGVKREAWKRKSRKVKTVFKTATDILADTEMMEAPPLTQQKVIDMTGPTVREVSLADIRKSQPPTWVETTTRLPELRHNLRLIVDLSRSDLENLSREKQSNITRMKALEEEQIVIRSRVRSDQERLNKLREVQQIAEELDKISRDALSSGAYEQANITALFGDVFERLQSEYMHEVRTLGLDALVVAVWAPIMKYKSAHWDVLADPTWAAADVAKWRRLLRSNDDNDIEQWAPNGRPSTRTETLNATPYEMMMNNIWLTKVRSSINNNWNVRDPDPIVQLLEAWKPLLPRFIFENIVNQLILPKISRAVSDWDPRHDPEMIHTWIHPWLPVIEAWRLGDLFTSIRHKLSVSLRQWHPSDESAIHVLLPWKEVWTFEQMEKFVIKNVIPKLTKVLRDEFLVNPRDQQLEPLIWCLAWQDLMSEATIGQLLENEFFNKWLDVLYKWLTLPRDRVNYDEIRQWYLWWRQVFESYGFDSNNKVISGCFRKGLDMMAMAANGEPVTRT